MRDTEAINATSIFRRETSYWALSADIALPVPITATQGKYIALLTIPLIGISILGLYIIGTGIELSLILGLILGALTAAALGLYLGHENEHYHLRTPVEWLTLKARWRRQPKGYIDMREYNPNGNHLYRIDAPIQISRRREIETLKEYKKLKQQGLSTKHIENQVKRSQEEAFGKTVLAQEEK